MTPKTQLALLDLRERGTRGRMKDVNFSFFFFFFLFFALEWGGAMGVKLGRVGMGRHRGLSLPVLWYRGSEVMLPPFARERRFGGGLSNNHFLWKVSKAVPLQHLCSCAWPTLDKTGSPKKDPFSPLLGVASLFDALHPLPLYLPWPEQCRLTTTAEVLCTLPFDAHTSTVTGTTRLACSTAVYVKQLKYSHLKMF